MTTHYYCYQNTALVITPDWIVASRLRDRGYAIFTSPQDPSAIPETGQTPFEGDLVALERSEGLFGTLVLVDRLVDRLAGGLGRHVSLSSDEASMLVAEVERLREFEWMYNDLNH